MLKTAVIGKTVNGTTQLSRLMVMSGDRIVLVDATTGQPPKKVITKMVGKDLHIFAEGATEPSVILNDYASFSQSIDISGIDPSGAYVNYGMAHAGSMELGAVTPVTAESSTPIMSTSAWWGVGILAVAGGVAAAAGGGGGGDSSTAPTPPDTTAPTAPVITAVATNDIINAAENTSLVVSGTGEIGATVRLAVANQTAIVDSSGNWSITVANAMTLFGEGSESLSVTQTDVAGNTSIAATRIITIDTIAPTVTISNDQVGTANIAGGDILYTFTFSETVSGFSAADVTVVGGTKAAEVVQTSPTTYTLVITPTGTGNLTVDIAAGATTGIADTAGNLNVATFQSIQAVDMVAPTVTSVILADPVLTIGETSAVTITFSEAVTNFDNNDVTLAGATGTLSTLTSADNIVWTGLFTPTALISDASNIIQVLNTYTDTVGNAGALGASTNFTIDTRVAPIAAPTFALTTDTSNVVSITNSDNITYTNGITVSAIAAHWEYSVDGGSTWTTGTGITFNLAENISYAPGDIQVRQYDATDNKSTIATNMQTTIVDTISPTLTITDNEPNMTANMDGSNADGTPDADGADILYTFTFDEAVKDLVKSDIVLTNGTANTFSKISDTVYTLGVTPAIGFEGSMTVSIESAVAHDIAGNEINNSNPSTLSSTQVVDMKAPVPTSWDFDYVNKAIIFTFDSPLEAVNMTNPGGFDVHINTHLIAVSAVAMLDNKVTLFMAKDFTDVESVRVLYKDVTTDITPAIQDLAGNDATSFTYLKPDVTPPAVTQIFFNNPNLSIGQSSLVTIYFSEEVKDLIVGFENGTLSGLAPTADASIWTATFTASANVELTSNSFSVGIGAYHDLNDLANVVATEYTYFVDTRAPSINIADDEAAAVANIAGGNITYTFTFSEPVTGFTLQDITITGGTPVGALSGSGAVYTLAIAPTAGVVGDVTIDVAANRVTDLLGNPNTIADQSIQAVDMKAPTVIISMDDAIVTSGDTPTVTFTFSEAVFGFDLADLDLTNANGILNNLSSADGGVTYSGLLIPTTGMPEDLSNVITLDGVYTDTAGNTGTLGASGNYIVDTKAPLYVSAAANNANDTITITFDDVLDAANHAVGTDFYVTDGSLTADLTDGNAVNQIDVLGIAVSGMTMTLSMKPMEAGIWKVIYTDTVGNTQYAIQDVYGSDTTGFSWTASVI